MVHQAYRDRRRQGPGRLVIRADEPTLTPYAGLAVTGELVRRLGLVELLDAELSVERRARPVKQRRRGLSPGELLVALAESQLAGGDCFDDLEDLRADGVGARLRAVAATPPAPTPGSSPAAFAARTCNGWSGRWPTLASGWTGRSAATRPSRSRSTWTPPRSRSTGAASAAPSAPAPARSPTRPGWRCGPNAAARLGWELASGNQAKLSALASARLARRALRLLPAGHGPVCFRIDSALDAVAFLDALRRHGARVTVSCPRSTAMWQALARIPNHAWQPAIDLPGAEVAETSWCPHGWAHEPLRLLVRRVRSSAAQLARDPRARRRRTIPPAQLQLALDGKLKVVSGDSFILADLDGSAVEVEWFHRQRAQIEERSKAGQARAGTAAPALGRPQRQPGLADRGAGRAQPGGDVLRPVPGRARLRHGSPAHTTATRGQTLRRLLVCVPARIVRTGRRVILRLPAGFAHASVFAATYQAVWALPPG